MISPRVDRLLENVDSPYASVVVAAKRARQINSLLPQPRRGHLRGVPAADDRHGLEELPHDRPRRGRGREDQVPLPRLSRTARWRASSSASPVGSRPTRRWSSRGWPRRPATRVRVIQTEASTRFVGTASFAAHHRRARADRRVGARPAARRVPRRPAARARAALAPRSSSRPPTSSSSRRRRPTRWPSSPPARPTTCSRAAALACRRPLSLAPAMNDAMYEHPATQANLATLRARGAIVLEPGTGALGSPGRVGDRPAARAARAARRDRGRARRAAAPGGDLDGLRVLVTAGGTREPIDAVRFIGNRSSGRMGFALADEAAPAAAPTSRSSPPTSRCRATRASATSTSRPPPSSRRLRRREFDALRRAADGRGRRRLPPGRAPRRTRSRRPRPARNSSCGSSAPRTCSPRLAARRRAGQLIVGFAAETRRAARSTTAATSWRARASTPSSSTTSSRAGHRLRRRRQRGHDRHRRDGAPRAAYDEGRGRGRDPRRRLEPPFIHDPESLKGDMEPIEPLPESVAQEEVEAAVGFARRDRGQHPPRRQGPRRRARATSSWRCSPRATSSSRTTRASARRRSPARSRARSTASSRASSARPTCSRPTSSAPTSTTSASSASSSGPARSSPTSCSSTRSTAPRRRRSRACSSACRSATSPSTCTRTSWRMPFMVFATQNPVEYEGTYPLPEAQVDRFMVRLSLGYPTPDDEAEHARRPRGRRPRARARAGRRPRPTCSPRRTPRAACTPRARCATTSSRCCATRATTRASSWARRRAPA